MAEFGLFLLEAVVGIALDRVFNPHENSALIKEVDELRSNVIGLRHQVASLDRLIQNVTGNVPDEVLRFRRVRKNVHNRLSCFDPTLVDFATELVASLLNGHALGFQLKVHASKKALNRGQAFETHGFEVILAASKTVTQNTMLLKDFLDDITQYASFQPMSKLEKPIITLNMVCGSTIDFKTLELMRYRIALRLVTLNAIALNWNTPGMGSLTLNNVPLSNLDDSMCKYVYNTEMDANMQVENFPNKFWSGEFKRLTDLLRSSVESSISCFRVLILSFDDWITNDDAEHNGFSSKIRTFISGSTTRCVEVRLKDYSHWDHINLEQILFWGLSMSIVVFRFATMEQLTVMLEASTQITMKYSGMMDDVKRVLFVETSSIDNVGHLRQEVKNVASKRRLIEPRDEEDILFEKSYISIENMMAYIRGRGESMKSIINSDVTGESRDLMISIARILNREVAMDEAIHEGGAVMKFASKIRGKWASSRIELVRQDGEMLLSNGDLNAGFVMQKANHVYDGEYVDFRGVPRQSSVHLKLNLRVYGMPHLFRYSWFRKWRALSELADLVQDQNLFLGVVCEEKKTLKRSAGGSKGRIVSSISVRAIGGGNWNDYLHARLQYCILQVGELQKKEASWVVLRVLLKLIPGLSAFCRKP